MNCVVYNKKKSTAKKWTGVTFGYLITNFMEENSYIFFLSQRLFCKKKLKGNEKHMLLDY